MIVIVYETFKKKSDPIITPEIFAQSIVDDYSLSQNYHPIITKSIQDQLSDYKAHSLAFGDDNSALNSPTDPHPPFTPFSNSNSNSNSNNNNTSTATTLGKNPNSNGQSSSAAVDLVMEKGRLEEEEGEWWEKWRENVRKGVDLKRMMGRGEVKSVVGGTGVGGERRKRRKVVKEEGGRGKDVVMGVPTATATTAAAVVSSANVGVNGNAGVGPVKMEMAMSVEEIEDDQSKYIEEMRILVRVSISSSFLFLGIDF